MNILIPMAVLALVTGATPGPGALAASPVAPSTDELVARHVAARGGMASLRAIQTLSMTGTMRPGGFDSDFVYGETIARPGAVRVESTLQGLTVVQAYDGRSGWQIQPFEGRKDPEALTVDDSKSLEEEADFEGGLIDAGAKGAKVENLGSIDVDGAPAWALRVSLKNGDQETYYLDPDAMLTVRVVTRQLVRGAEVLTQTDYGDYEKVNGVYFPFEIASGPKGTTTPQRITYAKIVTNIPVVPATFARPAPAAFTSAPQPPVQTGPNLGFPVPTPPRPGAVTPSSKPAGTPPGAAESPLR